MSKPPPIEYATRGKTPGPEPLPLFWKGLLIGLGYSALFWLTMVLGTSSSSSPLPAIGFTALGLKVLVTLVLLTQRRWRSLGKGLLTSSIIAFMIFFGICLFAIRNI